MDDARADLIEANISSFLLDMGTAGGGDTRSDPEIVWTVGGSPLSYHNAVVRCDSAPIRADALADEWLAELRRRELPGSWHVSPSTTPQDLPERLIAHGFQDAGDEPAMLADLSAPPPAVADDHELQIERVRNDAGMAGYRDVLAAGFGEGPREAEWVTSVFRSIGVGADSAWQHYLGRLDGSAPSTVSFFGGSGGAGRFLFCTLPDR